MPSEGSTPNSDYYPLMSELKAEISISKSLAEGVQSQVKAGRFPDLNSLVAEAVSRYIEKHPGELKEQFIRQDAAWGLYSDD